MRYVITGNEPRVGRTRTLSEPLVIDMRPARDSAGMPVLEKDHVAPPSVDFRIWPGMTGQLEPRLSMEA